MNRIAITFSLVAFIACFNTVTYAVDVKCTDDQSAAPYISPVTNGDETERRLKHAGDEVERGCWDIALQKYREVLSKDPKNLNALLGIAKVARLKKHLKEAEEGYRNILVVDGDSIQAMLGLAEVYSADYDIARASKIYNQAMSKWSDDKDVKAKAAEFEHRNNPKLIISLDGGLAFEERKGGFVYPLVFARNNVIVVEHGEYSRYDEESRLENYTRYSNDVSFTRYLGINRAYDFAWSSSEYHYHPGINNEYSDIDTYEKYSVGYKQPVLNSEHILYGRFSMRPTTLKSSQDSFVARSAELQWDSDWSGWLSTMLGGGWLHDLDSKAANNQQLTHRFLSKVGINYKATKDLTFNAKLTTNPELANNIRVQDKIEGIYKMNDRWSLLARYSLDAYFSNPNKKSLSLGARLIPRDNLGESEIGVKYEYRGNLDKDVHGFYGFASIAIRF